MNENDDTLSRVDHYRKIVLQYEALNKEINDLIMANNGGTKDMSKQDIERYRELAYQRDETLNEMRWLEQQLLD